MITKLNGILSARGNFVFDQSAHLLMFGASTNQTAPWRHVNEGQLWGAVGKTSPPISLELTAVIQPLTDFISLDRSLVNFETFCRCNFWSIAFFKRNRFLKNTEIRALDGNAIRLGLISSLRLFAFSSRKFEDLMKFRQLRPRNENYFDMFWSKELVVSPLGWRDCLFW